MEISFRPAHPGDAAVAIPLIYSSGPEAFDYIFHDNLKGSAIDFLTYAFVEGKGEMGYQNHLAVELDGQLVGIGAGWPGNRTLKFTFLIARQILSFYGLIRGLGVMFRGLRFEKIVRPPFRSQYVVAHLGVASNLRGRGIGKMLIATLIRHSREKEVILDVSDLNPKATALYKRIGFFVKKHRPSSIKRDIKDYRSIKIPGHSRMALKVESTS